MGELPARKSIRLKGYDYGSSGAYFVTICIKDRHELLGRVVGATVPGRPTPPAMHPMFSTSVELSEIGQVVESAIRHTDRPGVLISNYVIMPNHIHMIIVLSSSSTGDRGRSPLQMVLRNMKAYISKQIGFSPWQKSYHDHILRGQKDYRDHWHYINENPAKWAEDEYNPCNANRNIGEDKQ